MQLITSNRMKIEELILMLFRRNLVKSRSSIPSLKKSLLDNDLLLAFPDFNTGSSIH